MMQLLRRLCLVCVQLTLCLACAGKDEGLSSLLETERRFADSAVSSGMNTAFLKFLHDESILFRPHPVDGRAFTAEQPDRAISMTWHPTRAQVSRAGDLGFTTGPYTVESDDETEPVRGYFVSVWRRVPGGEWRVVIDLGTEDPEDEDCAESESFASPGPARDSTTGIDVVSEAAALVALERELGRPSDTETLAARLDESVRLYRDGSCPTTGTVAVRWALEDEPRSMTSDPIAARVASSGDLAYSYGSYVLRPDFGETAPVEEGYYVRVWIRDGADWQLALQITSPIPDEA